MVELSPLVRALNGTFDSKFALCLKTYREDPGCMFLPRSLGQRGPKYLRVVKALLCSTISEGNTGRSLPKRWYGSPRMDVPPGALPQVIAH